MRRSCFRPGQAVYIIWIEPNDYDYYYKVEDLSAIATIETIYTGEDGGIYRLESKAGQLSMRRHRSK